MTERSPSRAVYTALIGGYERLQEQPEARTSSVPFICLTDDPALTSDTWDVRLVEPALLRDPSRSSRFPKILGEPLGPDFTETLWIDNRVLLTADPDAVLDKLLADADVAVMHHSFRASVIAEFDEVARLGLDDPARIYEQLIHYAETKPHVLDLQPYWGGFIARRWTPEVLAAMRTWMDHVLRYSRRDQLSLRYALDGVDRVNAIDADNFGSEWHTWITDDQAAGRNTTLRSDAFRTAIRAPLASVAALEVEAAALRSDVAQLRTRVAGLRDKLTAERAHSAELKAQLGRRPSTRAAGAVRRLLASRRGH